MVTSANDRWRVACGECKIATVFLDNASASKFWIDHNNHFHSGKNVAIISKVF